MGRGGHDVAGVRSGPGEEALPKHTAEIVRSDSSIRKQYSTSMRQVLARILDGCELPSIALNGKTLICGFARTGSWWESLLIMVR